MIRLILFDIDGTLIKTGGAGEKAFAKVCEREFNIPDATKDLNFAGRTDPAIVRDFFKQFGIAPTPEHFARFGAAELDAAGDLTRVDVQTGNDSARQH